jgi:hypothetical protein
MPRHKGQKTKDEMAKDVQNYFPPGKRPKCLCCEKELTLNIHHPWIMNDEGQASRLDHEKVERVDYGYQGNGIFCTANCGFQYGLAVAKRLLHRKKEYQGESGNPLVDAGTIPRPTNMM